MSRIADGLQGHVEEIRREAVRLSRSLSESGCVEKVYPTDANFLLVKVSDADAVYHRLIESGILVRNRSSMAGCEGCLRVTVGTPAENDLTIEAFARIGRGDAPLAKRPRAQRIHRPHNVGNLHRGRCQSRPEHRVGHRHRTEISRPHAVADTTPCRNRRQTDLQRGSLCGRTPHDGGCGHSSRRCHARSPRRQARHRALRIRAADGREPRHGAY